MDSIKETLGFSHYAITVNYSPKVALSLVRSAAEIKSRDARLGGLTLPPAGVGPPPPMDAAHSFMVFNCIFYNNYGRHDPQISGKVCMYGTGLL